MFSGLSEGINSWFGAKDEDGSEVKPTTVENSENREENSNNSGKPDQPESEEAKENDDLNLDELSNKAMNTAKEWGTWLYGVGVNASHEIAKSAKTIKSTVEEKTILGDFEKEQKKFVTGMKEKKQKSEAAVPPWVGYNEEEDMKKQILSLSEDKRNFLRNPPAGVQFKFDFEASFPVAMATLAEDKNLEKMRFELVPKMVKEEVFWKNYFYRVSLIKQSAQLTTLAQQTGDASDKVPSESKPKDIPASPETRTHEGGEETEELQSSSPPDNEFISDAFDQSEFNTDELKKGLQQLGVGESGEDFLYVKKKKSPGDVADWEKELQAELQEYEVVDDGDEDDELEEELLKQIEAETK